MSLYEEMPFHPGELQVQKAMRVPNVPNPTISARSAQLASHIEVAPILALGAIDDEGWPWTTLAGGSPGLGKAIGADWIGLRAPVCGKYDPVVELLAKSDGVGSGDQKRMVSGLTIDLQARKRVKLYGRLIASMLQPGVHAAEHDDPKTGAELQLVLAIQQSLGNCPKYLNKRTMRPANSRPVLKSTLIQLPEEAIQLISKADLFFITSRNGSHDMDTNHRGGNSGFLQILSNEPSGAVICWPEYSGNRLYQTLGNLVVTTKAGLCIPDFDTGDVLYLTGTTEVLIGKDASEVLPRSNLLVKLTITQSRFVANALPFRGVAGETSPYNPRVSHSMSKTVAAGAKDKDVTVHLVRQLPITSSISRFTFALADTAHHTTGQYATFDFSEHLDQGYSHMRDDDPRSLNDDFVRTFTVSSRPTSSADRKIGDNEFEITIRNVGVATSFLFKHGLSKDSPKLELGFKGFDGEFKIEQTGIEHIVFIAAGVGVTPILPSLPDLEPSRLTFLWSIKSCDLPLVADVLKENPEFAPSLTLFVSDTSGESSHSDLLDVKLERRRLQKDDLLQIREDQKVYVCTAAPMRKQLMEWLPNKNILFEDFNF